MCFHALGLGCLFFFNDTATTEIYTLSLHDALPIYYSIAGDDSVAQQKPGAVDLLILGNQICADRVDRKSTRLNSSHQIISYAVFSLKKKSLIRLFFTPWPSLAASTILTAPEQTWAE